MRFLRLRSVFSLVLLLALHSFGQEIRYTVSVSNPNTKLLHVQMLIGKHTGKKLSLRIPAWCPGYYVILNYQDNIKNVYAFSSDDAYLPIQRAESREWQLEKFDPKVTRVEYDVACNDYGLGFFGCAMAPHFAFINGPSLFLYVNGRAQEPLSVSFKLPQGWDTATGMNPADKPFSYRAADYDELVDCPVQLGKFTRAQFTVNKVPMEAVFVAEKENDIKPDVNKVVQQLSAIAAPEINLFGGAPFSHYVFFFHLGPTSFGGGLEHRNSTVLGVGNDPNLWVGSLAAHEFFHLWNVKRIRPAVLGPFDYTKEQRTHNLWFAEGVTDYYAQIMVYRGGLQDKNWLLKTLGEKLSAMQKNDARKRVSADEASWQVWEGGQSQGFGGLSYYDKGLIIGFLLDLRLRAMSNGKTSLDDLMRELFKQCNPPNPGYEEDGILKALNAIAGENMLAFYNRLARSANELPINIILQPAGLKFDSQDNKNWTIEELPDPTPQQKALLDGWLKR